MEKRQVSRKPPRACEKIYKEVAENCPLRSIHRLSVHSKIPMSENGIVTANHPGGRTTDSPSKTRFFLRKLVAPYQTHPGRVSIPIQPGSSVMLNEKEKVENPTVSQQNNRRVIMINAPTVASVNAQPSKVSITEEAKTPSVSLEEKPKQKAETKIPHSNMIVIESPGQGINAIATPRVQSAAKPHMPLQGLQPKPQGQPAASVTNSTQVKGEKKPENLDTYDHNHKYSAYIDHVKNQLRTKSYIGEEIITAKPPTTTPTKRDSFNDTVSNFITRAKKDIKTTLLGD